MPWIETVKELAQLQNMDIKTAALYVAQERRFSRQLGGLQRSIEQARGELEMLNITITQKQEAITVLTRNICYTYLNVDHIIRHTKRLQRFSFR